MPRNDLKRDTGNHSSVIVTKKTKKPFLCNYTISTLQFFFVYVAFMYTKKKTDLQTEKQNIGKTMRGNPALL